MSPATHTPNHIKASFARTNVQTISQRVDIISELLPNTQSIAEVCCGDCFNQWVIYNKALKLNTFVGLDIDPTIVAANRMRGIECVRGDALDKEIVKTFLPFDVIFFGPPLSQECDGHSLIPFPAVVPGYCEFINLMIGDLNYRGTIVGIASKQTSLGDVNWLYQKVKTKSPGVGLRLIHYSYSTITGSGDVTNPRLKYVEIWMSAQLDDLWEIRESGRVR